jgi:hypothetical protein
MAPTCEGRYCNVCQKVVVDFSAMSDTAIVNYLAEAGGNRVCVRVKKSQLNRPMVSEDRPKHRFNIVGLFSRIAAMLVLAPVNFALAQTLQQQKAGQHTEATKDRPHTDTKLERTLHGRILNRNNNRAIAGVTVKAMGMKTKTDRKGRFQFAIPENYTAKSITVTPMELEILRGGYSFSPVSISTSKALNGTAVVVYGAEFTIALPDEEEHYLTGVSIAEMGPDTLRRVEYQQVPPPNKDSLK